MPDPSASQRVALVTGVSRLDGIGFAIARRLLADGCAVCAHGWSPHDAEQEWGADPPARLLDALGGASPRLVHLEGDLGDPDEPARAVAAAVERFGHVDVLVANHAHAARADLADVTAAELDRAWAVNARGSVLLLQAFAAQFDSSRGDGRAILFTSGQHLGPMPGELPYTISKGAIHQMTLTLSEAVSDRGITVNAVNPGPVDTGYASDEVRAAVAELFPAGRWGQPDDVAAVIAWLASPESRWVTGQIVNAEGGFRRW